MSCKLVELLHAQGLSGMTKKYRIKLTETERAELHEIIKKGKVAAHKRLHAQILLKADESDSGENWKDETLSEAYDIQVRTVQRIRKRAIEEGLPAALERARRTRNTARKLDGEQEAKLVALCCSEAPQGRQRWTLRLLASKMIELNYVDDISYEAVRQVLKKRNQTLAKERVVYSP